jgi:hypothetical protein
MLKFIIMYVDKDEKSNISIMEISESDAKDLASCLFEFEFMVNKYSILPESEQARLSMFSAKTRFLIIDALK